MFRRCFLPLLAFVVAGVVFSAFPALAHNPPNPYSSFNLSGINYGSMQWERDQRDGKVVWPYYNVPQRGTAGPAVSTGGRTGGAGNAAVRQRGGRGWRRGRR
ncbi:MAG: hypothetical protein WCJ31_02900 [Planctomycetia bacterium]